MTAADSAARVIAGDVLLAVAPTADRYAIHAALDERFGRRGEVGFLWSLGRLADGQGVRVRLSPDHPEAAAGRPVLAAPVGATFAFRLVANVTHKDRRTGIRRSWPLAEIAPRRRWLDRRAAEHGFTVHDVEIAPARAFIGKGRGFWIDETVFLGRLTVTESERFAAALTGGIGQRGAFGFGLLETFAASETSDHAHNSA
jgi:hypothetical protein